MIGDNPLASFIVEREAWMDDAACRGKPLSWFFPDAGGSKRKAYATCEKCPVRTECGEYAERTGTEYGIWDGKIRHRNEKNRRVTPLAASDSINGQEPCDNGQIGPSHEAQVS